MITREEIRWIHSLQLKRKTRRRYGLFVLEGPRSVQMALERPIHIEKIYAVRRWIRKHEEILQTRGIPVKPVTDGELKRLSTLQNPNQVLALVELPFPDWNMEKVLESPPAHILAIDGVQDPGNLGTILRVAHWFGLPVICASEETVDVFNPKVVQASMGSILCVPVVYGSLESLIDALRTRTPSWEILAADLSGIPLQEFLPRTASDPLDRWVLVVGQEGRGLSESVRERVDVSIRIESASDDPPDSLNVGVATGILLYHLRIHVPRQTQMKN